VKLEKDLFIGEEPRLSYHAIISDPTISPLSKRF